MACVHGDWKKRKSRQEPSPPLSFPLTPSHTTSSHSYVASEMFQVPGVLSVFVCGIIFSHFAWHSLAPEAQIGTAIFSHALSSAAETYSFTALGLSGM